MPLTIEQITQVDCDAAASMVENYWPNSPAMQNLARDFRGGYKHGVFPTAFAAHRLLGQQEGLRRAAEWLRAGDRSDPRLNPFAHTYAAAIEAEASK